MSHLIQIEEPESPDFQLPRMAIGIDLGTTHSVVALQREANTVPIPLPLGPRGPLVPSVVTYVKGKPWVGASQNVSAQNFLVRSSKRQLALGNQHYEHLKLDGTPLTPRDVAVDILKHLKEKTEAFLGHPIQEVVVTVPAHFDEKARWATRFAAEEAGLTVLRLVHEPTAAALAYGLDKNVEGLYGVYDLGGGTFDFSLLKLTQGIFQVIGTTGIVSLGGDDFDNLLARHLVEKGHVESSLVNQGTVNAHLLSCVRHLKEQLSDSKVVEVPPSLALGPYCSVTRKEYEALIAPLLEKTFVKVNQALKEAHVQPESLNGLILVGGATRTPLIKEKLESLYGNILVSDVNPDEVVAMGAAYQARALLEGEGTLLLDVTPLSLGIETMGGDVEVIIPKNSWLPSQKKCVFSTAYADQEEILVHVLQGEGASVEDCLSLGRIILKTKRISDKPRRIEVTFSLDVNGLLSVEATDLHSRANEKLQLKPIQKLEDLAPRE